MLRRIKQRQPLQLLPMQHHSLRSRWQQQRSWIWQPQMHTTPWRMQQQLLLQSGLLQAQSWPPVSKRLLRARALVQRRRLLLQLLWLKPSHAVPLLTARSFMPQPLSCRQLTLKGRETPRVSALLLPQPRQPRRAWSVIRHGAS